MRKDKKLFSKLLVTKIGANYLTVFRWPKRIPSSIYLCRMSLEMGYLAANWWKWKEMVKIFIPFLANVASPHYLKLPREPKRNTISLSLLEISPEIEMIKLYMSPKQYLHFGWKSAVRPSLDWSKIINSQIKMRLLKNLKPKNVLVKYLNIINNSKLN